MIEPVKVVTTHRLLHMMGESVAVVWNLKNETEKREWNGVEFVGIKKVPDGKPYIDFVDIRFDAEDYPFEGDDSPVDGGISPEFAKDIIKELQKAVEYISQITPNNK